MHTVIRCYNRCVLDLLFDSTLDTVNAVAEVEDMQLCSSSSATACNITSSNSSSSTTQQHQQQQLQQQQQQRPLAVLLKPADYYGGPYVSTATEQQLPLPLQALPVSMLCSYCTLQHKKQKQNCYCYCCYGCCYDNMCAN
jgi:hypothetical protein